MFFDKRPTKYVLIAGCRDFEDYSTAKKYIDFCLKNIKKQYKIIIISGGANGADKLGERYAHENKMKCIYYYPDWEKPHYPHRLRQNGTWKYRLIGFIPASPPQFSAAPHRARLRSSGPTLRFTSGSPFPLRRALSGSPPCKLLLFYHICFHCATPHSCFSLAFVL